MTEINPNDLAETLGDVLTYALVASGGAGWLSAAISDKAGGKWGQIAMKAINWLGANVGKAKNDTEAQGAPK